MTYPVPAIIVEVDWCFEDELHMISVVQMHNHTDHTWHCATRWSWICEDCYYDGDSESLYIWDGKCPCHATDMCERDIEASWLEWIDYT